MKDASFDAVYKIDATTVSVDQLTYDDDRSGQFVKITVNGQSYTAAELIAAGYSVEFSAFPSKTGNAITSTLFANDSTGELSDELDEDLMDAVNGVSTGAPVPTAGQKVYVQVKVSKGAEAAITSELTPITIKNIDLAGDALSAVNFIRTNTSNLGIVTSNKFVTGETFKVDTLKVKTANEEETVAGTLATVKSSDPAVLSVDSNNEVTAQAPGTATLTVTYGGATSQITVTVTNEARVASSVKFYKGASVVSSDKFIAGQPAQTFKFRVFDQFGDRIAETVTAANTDANVASVNVTTAATATTDGVITVTPGVKAGSTTVSFKSAIDNALTGTFRAYTTLNNEVATYKFVSSDDDTIDVLDSDDQSVTFSLFGFTSENLKVGTAESLASGYTITVKQSQPGVIASTYNGTSNTPLTTTVGSGLIDASGNITVKGLKAGTAVITAKNDTTGKSYSTTVKVIEQGLTVVKGSSFKTIAAPTFATAISYKDVFANIQGSNDAIIQGLKLSKASSHPVRLDTTGTATNTNGDSIDAGDFYLDKDADGVFNNDDVILGSVQVSYEGKFTTAPTLADFLATGINVVKADEGTIIFKVLNEAGTVVDTTSVKVNF